MSSSGAGMVSWRRTKPYRAAAPSRAAASVGPVKPWVAASLTAYTTAIMPTSDRTTLIRSQGPGFGLRDSGRVRMPTRTRTAITGRLMRKTEPHQKCSSRKPPVIGPTAVPAEAVAPQMPTARLRSRGSWKMLRIRARVAGIRVAPATPSSARARIMSSGVVA